MGQSSGGRGQKSLTGAAILAWAWEQELPPAEKLLLLAIADNAGKGGAWLFGAQKEMAVQTGMGERTVRRHLAGLEERGLIRREAVYEMGYRVPDHIVLAVDGELPANLAASAETPAKRGSIPAKSATGQSGRALLPSSRSSSQESLSKEEEAPGQFDRDAALAELSDEIRADALALLDQRRSVDRKRVTEREMLVAAAALAEFNRQSGADYGLGANLTSIVMRIRERPAWDAAKHVRLVQSAWRIRWWERNGERRATPNVVYGERSFENVVQDAADEAAGRPVHTNGNGLGPLKGATYSGGRSWDELTKREQEMARENFAIGRRPGERDDARPVVPSGQGVTAADIAAQIRAEQGI